MVKIETQLGGQGGTIETLGRVIQQRMNYLGETARDSIAATAITVLKSIRTKTTVAKSERVKVDVKRDTNLFPSIYIEGGKKKLCLRFSGTKQRYHGKEAIISCVKAPMKTLNAYKFVDKKGNKEKTYYIIASNQAMAKERAKSIVQKRIKRYAGLAKRAIGWLMFKTNTKRVNDGETNANVETVANKVTNKVEQTTKDNNQGGTYTMTLTDDLFYAMEAIKGGKIEVDTQMKKACNKVVSIINQKLSASDFFGEKKIDTPFPEVRQRRK